MPARWTMNLLDAMSMVLNQREISMSQTGLEGIEDIISDLDAWFIPNKIWGLKSAISEVSGVSKSIFNSVMSSRIASQCSLPTKFT